MKKISCFAACKAALLLLVSFSIFPAEADELYKWVDDRGKVTYQGSPPPENAARVERSNITTGNRAAFERAEAVKPATKNVEPVIFYSKMDCSSCKTARLYFEENDIPFEEINLSENKAEEEKLEKKLGYSGTPTFAIGDKYVSGFEKGMLKKILTNEGYEFPPEEKKE